MSHAYTLSDAQLAPRPASPLQEARVIIYRPSHGDIFSLDKTRLSLPSLTREVFAPTRKDIASLMSTSYAFHLASVLYHELERTISDDGLPLTYFLAALGSHEEMPRGVSLSLASICNGLYLAAPEDLRCLRQNFSSANLC